MSEILKLPHFLEQDCVPEVQIGPRWVESGFDTQRHTAASGRMKALFEFTADVKVHDSPFEEGELFGDGGNAVMGQSRAWAWAISRLCHP